MYEYKTFVAQTFNVEYVLKDAASYGWEFVSITPLRIIEDENREGQYKIAKHLLIFKRKK